MCLQVQNWKLIISSRRNKQTNKENRERKDTLHQFFGLSFVDQSCLEQPFHGLFQLSCKFVSVFHWQLQHSKILPWSLLITSLMLMWSVSPSSTIHFSSRVSLGPLLGLFSTSGEKLKNDSVIGFVVTKVARKLPTQRCGYFLELEITFAHWVETHCCPSHCLRSCWK